MNKIQNKIEGATLLFFVDKYLNKYDGSPMVGYINNLVALIQLT